ncbi:MAG: adenine-specific methyltransferase EcoRI family protein, partial [Bacteroidales bacterium]|nr:adenine-specific methyltransferase EcoRI family protein [Bacteroidales bacterium]
EADIVVTNPPFSLFREYVAQMMDFGKKFLIIGNVNAITCKEIFPLFRDNKLWLGPSITSGDRKFNVPDDYPLNAAGCGIDEQGKRFIRVKGVRWFTNLDHNKRHETLDLVCRYTPDDYPHYDSYDAIEVGKTADIPCNYSGVMGVPITFLDKYNPEQFEIIGIDRYVEDNPIPGKRFTINNKEIYARILIRNKHPQQL